MGVVTSGILAPFIANPFLLDTVLIRSGNGNNSSHWNKTRFSNKPSNSITITNITNATRTVLISMTGNAEDVTAEYQTTETSVQYVYICVSLACVLLGLPFFLLDKITYLTSAGDYETMDDNEDRTKNDGEVEKAGAGSSRRLFARLHGWFVFLTVFLYSFNSLGIYFINSVFIRSISIDLYGFSRDSASTINSVYYLGAVTGCVASTGLVLKFSTPKVFLFFNTVLLLACCLLYTLSTRVLSLFWLSTFIMGVPSGPLIGIFTAYTNEHVVVDGILLAMTVLARGLSDLVFVFVAGYLYDTYGTMSVLKLIISLSVIVLLHALIYVIVGWKKNKALGKSW